MKRIFTILFIFTSLLSVSALTIEDNLVVDESGNKIPLKQYERIIILSPATVEMAYLLGAENKLAAIGHTKRTPIWPEDKTANLPSVGSITKPSLEKVLSFNPDLVFLNAMITDFGNTLKSHNIPVLIISGESIDGIFNDFTIFGKLLGYEKKAKEISSEKRRALEKIKKKIASSPVKLKGSFFYTTNPFKAFGDGSLPGEILKILGVDNIASGLGGGSNPSLSPEYILEKNPDFIFGSMSIKKKEDLMNSHPVIKMTTAGKKGNIFLISSSMILRPSPRIVELIEDLHKMLEGIK